MKSVFDVSSERKYSDLSAFDAKINVQVTISCSVCQYLDVLDLESLHIEILGLIKSILATKCHIKKAFLSIKSKEIMKC